MKSKSEEPAASVQPDKYDLAIKYLTSHPDEIVNAWGDPEGHKAGCLFQYATRVRPPEKMEWNVGCLTLIRRDTVGEYAATYLDHVAETPELTKRIQNDERIPIRASDIQVEDLPIFAEWQRILDRELGHE